MGRSALNYIMLETLALNEVADYFKVLSEVSRLQVLNCLKSDRKSVSEIVTLTGLGQANVSKHLKTLAQMGIISRHPEGIAVYYKIADPLTLSICELVCDRLVHRLDQRSNQLKQLNSAK